jgi:hypothetical protein
MLYVREWEHAQFFLSLCGTFALAQHMFSLVLLVYVLVHQAKYGHSLPVIFNEQPGNQDSNIRFQLLKGAISS